MLPRPALHGLLRSMARQYSGWRERRCQHLIRHAAEQHALASNLPGHEFSDEGGRLNKLRFLRREHMFLDWSSWHSSFRD